ncbi:MAG: tetratricopeptide repeat protein [Acidobacteriota bacterium]
MSQNPQQLETATANGAPAPRQLFIVGPWQDFVLFVGTPLLILPAMFFAQRSFRIEEIALFVASFGALGHHLPGMMRAYGDRDLFERFRTRFMLAPVFLAVICLAFTLHDMSGIMLVVYLWGVWHGLMQTYGFLRIYDSKVRSFGPLTARLDHMMCLAWFIGGVLLSPTRMQNLLSTFYKAGGPLIPGSAVTALQSAVTVGVALVTVAFFANMIFNWTKGTPPSPIKLMLMVTSFGFWWYANVSVENMLVGIALFEVFHDVQYLSIVWLFNRKRADQPGGLNKLARFLFARSGALAGVYVGLVFAYGSLNYVATGMPMETLKRALIGLLLASALLHFYYDGFIWKVREQETRKGLGLEGGKNAKETAPGWLIHGARWALFVLPVAYLGAAEMGGVPSRVERAQAVAEALPNYAEARYNLGVAFGEAGDTEAAIEQYRLALELDPESSDASFNLGNALTEQGELDEAIAAYRAALENDPDTAQVHSNLGSALLESGDPATAVASLEKSLELDPKNVQAYSNLGNALVASGRGDEAMKHYREALELDPDFAEGRYNLARLLSHLGRGDEAIEEYLRVVKADGDFAEAHYNLANALARRGDLERAVAHYRSALRTQPEAGTHFNLANTLTQLGRAGEAVAEYQHAIRVDPSFAPAYHNLGAALYEQGRLQEALDLFAAAVEVEPGYGDAHRNLGLLLRQLGQTERAEHHLAEARRLAS